MNILVVGAKSQVGSALIAYLKSRDTVFGKLDYGNTLLLEPVKLAEYFASECYSYVVNVDHFEGFIPLNHSQSDFEQRHLMIPQNLARACEKAGIPLIQLSDCQVFSGLSDKPYSEEDEPHARTMYGVTRWQGEVLVQRFTSRYIVLRVGDLFTEQGMNFLAQSLELWRKGKGVQLSTSIQFAPTPTIDMARVIYAIIQQLDCGIEPWGIYHYCSADIATPYDFAEVTLAALNQFSDDFSHIKLKAVDTRNDLPAANKRIHNSEVVNTVLSCEKIRNTFGVRQRPWRGELIRCVERLVKETEQESLGASE